MLAANHLAACPRSGTLPELPAPTPAPPTKRAASTGHRSAQISSTSRTVRRQPEPLSVISVDTGFKGGFNPAAQQTAENNPTRQTQTQTLAPRCSQSRPTWTTSPSLQKVRTMHRTYSAALIRVYSWPPMGWTLALPSTSTYKSQKREDQSTQRGNQYHMRP
jgi:hypothetical protein